MIRTSAAGPVLPGRSCGVAPLMPAFAAGPRLPSTPMPAGEGVAGLDTPATAPRPKRTVAKERHLRTDELTDRLSRYHPELLGRWPPPGHVLERLHDPQTRPTVSIRIDRLGHSPVRLPIAQEPRSRLDDAIV